jgi:predicted O-methyltransferase YrrM
MITLDELLQDPPKVHSWAAGKLTSSGLSAHFFKYIFDRIGSTSETLETGAGISTVVFALKQARHVCVAPDSEEIGRLKIWCETQRISTSSIEFQTLRSDQFFQTWSPKALDLVLIDGCHGFPAPFIDWFYTAAHIRVGGVLVVDDTHLWTGARLKDFLLREPEWRLDGPKSSKTAAFVKVADYVPWKEWIHQPYVLSRSPHSRLATRARAAFHLARTGQYQALAKKTVKYLFNVTER